MWGYTPRVIEGFLKYANARHRQELAEQLTMMAIATQGSGRQIQDLAKDLNTDD